MIKYQLQCKSGHTFEGWFTNSAAFDKQAATGHVECPHCKSSDVKKALMAPNVGTKSNKSDDQPAKLTNSKSSEVRHMIRAIHNHLKTKAEYVGADFADEARKIHDDVADKREIWGEATQDETAELLEDGILVLPVPQLPDEHN